MRPATQLFMLQSLDGKISTGTTDDFDVDQGRGHFPIMKYTDIYVATLNGETVQPLGDADEEDQDEVASNMRAKLSNKLINEWLVPMLRGWMCHADEMAQKEHKVLFKD